MILFLNESDLPLFIKSLDIQICIHAAADPERPVVMSRYETA